MCKNCTSPLSVVVCCCFPAACVALQRWLSSVSCCCLLDTLPVCRDFKSSQCNRPQCKFVHLLEEYVEVTDGKVTVCRDSVKGKCRRQLCKYYHIPVILPAPAAPALGS